MSASNTSCRNINGVDTHRNPNGVDTKSVIIKLSIQRQGIELASIPLAVVLLGMGELIERIEVILACLDFVKNESNCKIEVIKKFKNSVSVTATNPHGKSLREIQEDMHYMLQNMGIYFDNSRYYVGAKMFEQVVQNDGVPPLHIANPNFSSGQYDWQLGYTILNN